MAEFQKMIKVSDLSPGMLKTVHVNDEDVLLANIGGEYYAVGAICNHQQWDLSEGSLDGTKVTCAGHGAIWDLATGKAEFDEPLEDELMYDVKVDEGYLYVKKR